MFVACEHCNSPIKTPEEAHSMLIVLQRVTTSGYSWYQCERGAENAHRHTFQHWHCGHEPMQVGAKQCIREHYQESDLVSVPTTQVRLHKIVLQSGLTCKVCGQALTAEAYRFCLTHATPVSSIPDDSHNDLGEWCCSLEHAKQSASAIVANS